MVVKRNFMRNIQIRSRSDQDTRIRIRNPLYIYIYIYVYTLYRPEKAERDLEPQKTALENARKYYSLKYVFFFTQKNDFFSD